VSSGSDLSGTDEDYHYAASGLIHSKSDEEHQMPLKSSKEGLDVYFVFVVLANLWIYLDHWSKSQAFQQTKAFAYYIHST
jgi:hypothetical protein